MITAWGNSRQVDPLKKRQDYKGRCTAIFYSMRKPQDLNLTMGTLIYHQLLVLIFFCTIMVPVRAPSSSNKLNYNEKDTATAQETDLNQRVLNAAREATARLRSHLRSIRVAREHTAPLTSRNDSQPKVTLSLSPPLSLSLSLSAPLSLSSRGNPVRLTGC